MDYICLLEGGCISCLLPPGPQRDASIFNESLAIKMAGALFGLMLLYLIIYLSSN